jgi:hypothetical protein
MGGAHEVAEKIEHVAHEQHGGGHGADNTGKFIGLTMAILGVLLALCSAMVGAERTELTKTMVEQANVYNEYQASSTKYRVLLGSMQQLYAQTPSRKLTEEVMARLDQMPVPAEQQATATLQKQILKETMTLLQPRKSEVEGFLTNVARYNDERAAAKHWAESWDDEVNTHFEGSEKYEKGQLLAEIGIVIASIALLLHNRLAWFVSIGAAVGCLAIVGTTWVSARGHLHAAEAKIHEAEHHYQELRGKKDANGKRLADVRDEELLQKVRERFGIAAQTAAADPHAAPAAPAAPAAHH